MATRHDSRNRPVHNALLKWQLQQDQRRIVEVQRRLMRMAAPSPSSSLGVNSGVFDRRPAARRPRPQHHEDPEEDALMHLIMEREQQEATSNQQSERPIGVKPSRLQYPSVLPPLRRSETRPKPPLRNPVKNITLKPTGQKLNAAGDFYSPVRPRESALNSSSSEFRQNLAFSRIKAPAPKRLVGATAAPSPRNPLRYDQMKTPDRWRTTAMHSNQDEFDESALRRWEEEDALQADRLLEKAARDGDSEVMWSDLFYGTKAARTKTNQRQNDPEQPVVYSTSSFPEVFSRSRDNSHGISCYEAGDDPLKSPLKSGIGDDGMLPSDLSTMSTSERTKPSTTQHSDVGYHVVDSTGASPVRSGQSISEMLASMEKASQVEPSAGDLVAGDDHGNDDSSGGGGDRDQFVNDEMPAGDLHFVQAGSVSSSDFPRWSIIVVASCLVVGTSGFFMEELMSLMGLFSKNTPFSLSRAEQERMRDRVSVLQQELQGFQLSTSKIEVKSQTVLSELQRHMDRMRLDREHHQDVLTNEMQELRHHILHITQDMVGNERKSIQAQLEEIVKVRVIEEEKAADRVAITGTDIENAHQPEETTAETPILAKADEIVHECAHESRLESSAASDIDRRVVEQVHSIAEQSQELIVVPSQPEVVISFEQTPSHLETVQVHAEANAEAEITTVGVPPWPLPEELENVHDSHIESLTQALVEEISIERVQKVAVSSAPALDEVVNKIDVAVGPSPKVAVIVKPSRSPSTMSWEGILLLVGIMFLAACVVLRVYNINRRKRWFEERRKRRNQRALRLAQQRARAMADTQDDSDEWGSEETDEIEEVSLMTPLRDSEDDEAKQELQRQSPDIETDFEDHDHSEEAPQSPAEAYRVAASEQSARTSTRGKSRYSRGSPLLLRQRSPRQRRQHHVPDNY